jgi:hypothetical protein
MLKWRFYHVQLYQHLLVEETIMAKVMYKLLKIKDNVVAVGHLHLL